MSKAESVREKATPSEREQECESGTGALPCVCFQLKYNAEWVPCNQVDFLRLQNILFTRVIRRFDAIQALAEKCNASICTISTHKCGFLLISCFLGMVLQCLTRRQLSSFIFSVLLVLLSLSLFLSLFHSHCKLWVCVSRVFIMVSGT